MQKHACADLNIHITVHNRLTQKYTPTEMLKCIKTQKTHSYTSRIQPTTNICPQLFGVNYTFGALDVKPLLVLGTALSLIYDLGVQIHHSWSCFPMMWVRKRLRREDKEVKIEEKEADRKGQVRERKKGRGFNSMERLKEGR